MSPVDLMEQLKLFCENALQEVRLPVKVKQGEEPVCRPPAVYLMNLPSGARDLEKAPYVILQFINGSDQQEEGDQPYSTCNIRLIVGTYDKDEEAGRMAALDVIVRLRTALLEAGEIANRYTLQRPLDYIVYPDNIAPFYIGEMMTVWLIPTVERKFVIW